MAILIWTGIVIPDDLLRFTTDTFIKYSILAPDNSEVFSAFLPISGDLEQTLNASTFSETKTNLGEFFIGDFFNTYSSNSPSLSVPDYFLASNASEFNSLVNDISFIVNNPVVPYVLSGSIIIKGESVIVESPGTIETTTETINTPTDPPTVPEPNIQNTLLLFAILGLFSLLKSQINFSFWLKKTKRL